MLPKHYSSFITKLISMQKNITKNYFTGFCKVFLMLLATAFLSGKLSAQVYVNGNLSTGATSSNGTAAPAGFTWSELQGGNGTFGFLGSVTSGNIIADDFTVPAGPNWTISKITFYGYQTGYAGTTSPFTTIRVRIHSGSVTGPVVFGDLTTNRFATSTSALMYRTAATTGLTRQIWAIDANVSASLPPGTYWLEWQTDVTGSVNHFLPTSTVLGVATVAGYNAQLFNAAGTPPAWGPMLDGTNAMDMPFRITYATTSCAGTPAPGNTISTSTSVCSGVSYTLSAQNPTAGIGITYQWQSAPSVTGTFTDIPGATNPTYTTNMTGSMAYQLLVTCSGNTGTSTPVLVSQAPATQCYCTPPPTNCNLNDVILNVTVSTLNNNSTCGTAGYTNYTTTAPTANLVAGGSHPMSVRVGPGGTENVGVWIDYNVNGIFEASEYQALGSGNGVTISNNLNVPAFATPGVTRMRVRVRFATALQGADACLGYTYGETEDYSVRIVPCVVAAITTQPTSKTVGCNDATSFTVATTGSLVTYLWQTRATATSPWVNVTNGAPYAGATTNTLSLSNIPGTFNGRQYRVLYAGACKGVDSSNVVTLTVGPLVAVANPTSGAYCPGGAPVQIQVSNQGGPATTNNFCSGTISVTVPDNLVSGAVSTIPVSIPAGAVITSMAVRFSMTHTWAGDMVMALKAPNGQILNLDYFLTNTGGAGVTTGFVNTIISSAGINALRTGTNPYTNTFRADALNGTPVDPGGPTGYAPTTTTWSALYPAPTGDWTLAMYDGAGGDIGRLTTWCLDITYAAPGTGVFTPTTGLFTDAAGTIPYTGTPISIVYAAPTVSTDYQLVVSNSICSSSAPLTIPISVASALTGASLPATFGSCLNGVTTLTADVTNGNNVSYVWQVSTDGGATWTNISNGGLYSDATTGTLTISGATDAEDGFRYRVIASNPCNTVTSNASVLTINPLPDVQLSANPFTKLLPNLTTTLSAAVSPNPGATYTWYYNGQVVPNATANTLVVDIDHLGDYYVEVSDVNTCGGTSNVVTISDSASNIVFIYPSPNTGQFQVRYTSLNGNVLPRMLNIYDAKGARVYSKSYAINTPYTKMDVDMRRYGKGIYMVELSDNSGRRIATGRVVIF